MSKCDSEYHFSSPHAFQCEVNPVQVVFHSPVCQFGGVGTCCFWPRYVSEAQLAPMQCCARRCGKVASAHVVFPVSTLPIQKVFENVTSEHRMCVRGKNNSSAVFTIVHYLVGLFEMLPLFTKFV